MTHQSKLVSLTMAIGLALLAGSSAFADGDKLSKEDKKWIEEEVSALITAEEIKIFKDLKSKDRKLFREIFWARRDPNPMTPKNEFIDEYNERVKGVDESIKNVGVRGSLSDMGQVALLLGSPAENNRDGQIVTWRYDPRPGLGIPDGLTVQFRDMGMGLRRVGSGDVDEKLERVKTVYLTNRGVTYSIDEDGRLLKPSSEFDPNSPAKKLLQEMIETQTENAAIPFEATSSFFKAEEGAVYVPVLFEINAEALTWKKDKATATATVFGAVQNAEGQTLFPFEELVELENKNGVARYEMPLQVTPGSYTALFGVLDNESNTVGTRVFPVEVPDFVGGEGMMLSSVLVFSEELAVESVAGTPGHGFQFGQTQFVPSKMYSTSGYIGLFYFVYGFGVDEETGEANLTAQYIFFREGKRRGQTAPEPLQVELSLAGGLAQIPLATFEPGDYKVQVKVIDKVTKKTIIEEIEFVVEGASE